MKFTVKAAMYLLVAVLGIVIYLLAVSGALFRQPTPATDIGLYVVTSMLLVFGIVGAITAMVEGGHREAQDPAYSRGQ